MVGSPLDSILSQFSPFQIVGDLWR